MIWLLTSHLLHHIAHVSQNDQQSRYDSTIEATERLPGGSGRLVVWATLITLLLAVIDILFGNAILLRPFAEHPPDVPDSTDSKPSTPPPAQSLPPGTVFKDCPGCPELVVIPAGTFEMGSPPDEKGRYSNEGPVRTRTIPTAIAIGTQELTRGAFRRFVETTAYDTGRSCWTYERDRWADRSQRTWRNPGYDQTDDHPVVCVNWRDAKRYVSWLSTQTGHTYRLPTEVEWEYAARARTTTAYYWGDKTQCGYANAADQSTTLYWRAACDDGHRYTAPKATYLPNPFGLFDVLGNVWEWTADCWTEQYGVTPPICTMRVLRGGSRYVSWAGIRSAHRYPVDPSSRNQNTGFRIARSTVTPIRHDAIITANALHENKNPIPKVAPTEFAELPGHTSAAQLSLNCDTLVRDINGIPLSDVQDETVAEVISELLKDSPVTEAAITCAGRVAKSAQKHQNHDRELARVIDAALAVGFCKEARSFARDLKYNEPESQQRAKVARNCLGSN